jgi:putative transposase
LLADWPLPRPSDWMQTLNRIQRESDAERIRACVRKGTPFGSTRWVKQSAVRLGLEATLRPRGRPKK